MVLGMAVYGRIMTLPVYGLLYMLLHIFLTGCLKLLQNARRDSDGGNL